MQPHRTSYKAQTQYELNKPPQDGITSLNFAPENSQYLLATSWDTSVSLYDIYKNERIQYYKHESPVLTACFIEHQHYCVSAGTDGNIVMKNIKTGQKSNLCLIGEHAAPVRTSCYNSAHSLLFTGSWDTKINVYDPKISNFDDTNLVKTLSNHGKIFAMDLISNDKLAVATSNQDIYIWDLRYLVTPCQKRKSTLANQIRDICAFPKGAASSSGSSSELKEGFVSCSTEGRASVEFLDPISSKLVDKFAFKCHRNKDENGIETIHPVNSISFSKKYQTFATAGSDGFVNIWDPFAKKRIYQLPKYPVGVVNVSFGNDVSKPSVIAVACSYNYELEVDPIEVPSDRIYIRNLEEGDIMRNVKS